MVLDFIGLEDEQSNDSDERRKMLKENTEIKGARKSKQNWGQY